MTKKLLIGVTGQSEEELEWVKKKIDEKDLTKVGIELRQDYEELEKYGIVYGFYGDIAKYVKEKGFEVIPLESPEASNEQHSINLAMYVKKGNITEDDLKSKLRKFRRNIGFDPAYSDPLVDFPNRFFHKNYSRAVEILKEVTTLDDVMKMQEAIYKIRREQMIESIGNQNPDLVVVGFGHSPELDKSLQEYNHIISPFAEEMLR